MNNKNGDDDDDDDDNDENIYRSDDDLPFVTCTSKSFCINQSHFRRGSVNFNNYYFSALRKQRIVTAEHCKSIAVFAKANDTDMQTTSWLGKRIAWEDSIMSLN